MKKISVIILLSIACIALSFALGGCKSVKTAKQDASSSAVQSVTGSQTADPGKPSTPVKEDTLGVLSFTEEEWLEYGIPSAFDLRSVDIDGDGIGDRCFVTKVKCQNPFGTCWAFSALAAAETSLLGSVYLDDPDAYKTLDLSEKQIAYFAYVALNEDGNPQNGEGCIPVDKNGVYNYGGFSFSVIYMMAQGIGPVDENKEGNEIYAYSGKNGYKYYRLENGELTEVYYSQFDDWTIPDEARFYAEYSFEEGCSIYSIVSVDKENVVTLDEQALQDVKLQLLQRRGVSVSFCADSSRPTQQTSGDGDYLTAETWSHYTWENVDSNHAVTIIGWDDNYPKENFIEGHQPPADGAWLVKNSWGSEEEDFPNARFKDWGIRVPETDENGNVVLDENGDPVMVNSGYFWMSYYDMSANSFTFFTLAEKEENVHIDQHDLTVSAGPYCDMFNLGSAAANVFKAETAEMLDSVYVCTPYENFDVDIEIYLLDPHYTSPVDGYCVEKQSYFISYEGIHRLYLDEQVLIQKGQYYSIVVRMRDEEGDEIIPFTYDLSRTDHKVVRVINEGESFYLNDSGEWADYVEFADKTSGIFSNDSFTLILDNPCIKGHCYTLDNTLSTSIFHYSDQVLFLTEARNSKTFVLSFDGMKPDKPTSYDVKWFIADEDGDEYATLIDEGNGVCKFIAKKAGKVHIAATVEGLGTAVVSVVTTEMELVGVSYSPTFVYTGKEIKPAVVLTGPNNEHLFPGKDYAVEYSDNVKCGIGKITLTPLGDLSGKNSEPEICYFVIEPEKPVIESAKIENGKLVGSVKDQSAAGITSYWVYYEFANGDWDGTYIYDANFEIDLDGREDVAYVSVTACVIVTDAAPEEFLDKLAEFDDDDNNYYLESDWSENYYFDTEE